MKKKIFAVVFAAVLLGLFAGCSVSSSFIGTWADNSGNTVMLNETAQFVAKINGIDVQGGYTSNLNTMTWTTKVVAGQPAAQTYLVEWDVRGNVLFLTFTDNTGATWELKLFYVGEAV